MSKLDRFFSELEDKEFPIAIQTVNSHIYELLENQQNKSSGGKVTKEIMQTVKKCFDYVSMRMVLAHRECVAAEIRLKTIITDSKAYEALRIRRSGVSDSVPDKTEETTTRRKGQFRDTGFSVVLTPRDTSSSILDIKDELKKALKEDADFPVLTDVIATKAGQLVFRVPTKSDSEKLKDTIKTWADRVKITTPRRRRCRVLLLSVNNEASEEEVFRSVRGVLLESGIDEDREIEVIRKINTRAGATNWLLDVDSDCFDCLIERKRICINLERYKVVEFVQITRCFKCQKFGHLASKCTGIQRCVKCSGEHHLKECGSSEEVCANCKDDDDVDAAHRADSVQCPSFLTYRGGLLSARRL